MNLYPKSFSCVSYFCTWFCWCLSNGWCIFLQTTVSLNFSVLKWSKELAFYAFSEADLPYSPHCAPSILITFINMVLFKDTKFDPACNSATMYAGQLGIQKLLVLLALVCVPWMLLAKPIIIMRRQRKLNYTVSIGTANIFKSNQASHTYFVSTLNMDSSLHNSVFIKMSL